MDTLRPSDIRPVTSTAPDFDSWVAARGPGLLRFALAVTGDRRGAEQLVTAALSRALPRWYRLARTNDLDSYAKRLIVNTRVPSGQVPRHGDPPMDESLQMGEASPPDATPAHGVDRRLWRACDGLPRAQRTAVVLRHYELLEVAEIAWYTRARERTVRSRLSRAMGALGAEDSGWRDGGSVLEQRLREALQVGAEGAFPATDLAARVRARAAVRRQRRMAGAGVAAAALGAIGLVTVVDSGTAAKVPRTAEDATAVTYGDHVPAGWRSVRWHGATVQVPEAWSSGALSAWCEGGQSLDLDKGLIERPTEPAGRCSSPALSYGVQFLGPGAEGKVRSHDVRRARPSGSFLYPKGAWVGVTCGGCEVALRVVAPDPYVAKYLLSTYQPPSSTSAG